MQVERVPTIILTILGLAYINVLPIDKYDNSLDDQNDNHWIEEHHLVYSDDEIIVRNNTLFINDIEHYIMSDNPRNDLEKLKYLYHIYPFVSDFEQKEYDYMSWIEDKYGTENDPLSDCIIKILNILEEVKLYSKHDTGLIINFDTEQNIPVFKIGIDDKIYAKTKKALVDTKNESIIIDGEIFKLDTDWMLSQM